MLFQSCSKNVTQLRSCREGLVGVKAKSPLVKQNQKCMQQVEQDFVDAKTQKKARSSTGGCTVSRFQEYSKRATTLGTVGQTLAMTISRPCLTASKQRLQHRAISLIVSR